MLTGTAFKEIHRVYRRPSQRPGESSFQIVVEESDLWITVNSTRLRPDFKERLADLLIKLRADIKNAILLDPTFQTSLIPIAIPAQAPPLIQSMGAGARVMDVGPMATVAGAISEAVARHFVDECQDIIVENGGDTYLFSTRERVVALLPDPATKALLGVLVKPEDSPVSFCASSGKFGHSLSLGNGDLAVIRGHDGALTDAAATAICNMLKGPGDIDRALARMQDLVENQPEAGLEGAFLQCAGRVGVWGNMELAAV